VSAFNKAWMFLGALDEGTMTIFEKSWRTLQTMMRED